MYAPARWKFGSVGSFGGLMRSVGLYAMPEPQMTRFFPASRWSCGTTSWLTYSSLSDTSGRAALDSCSETDTSLPSASRPR